jgi:diguanylate cyclase (GGDEF)-like protein/PAS domain S-box-containing protein
MISDNIRKRLELALDAAQMSVWDSQVPNGSVADSEIFWSENGFALLGFEAHQVKQTFKEFLASVHPEDRQRILNTMQDAVDRRSGYELEYRVVWPDSSIHWLSAKAHVLVSAGGRSVRTLGIIWDITAPKQAETAIAEQKELAQVTLGSIGDGVITTDAAGITRYLNRVAEQLTGWSNNDLKHSVPISRIFKVVDEETGKLIENVAIKCLYMQQAIGVTTRSQLITRDGRKIPIEDSAAPIRTEDGRVLGAVVVFHDVSHERALKHELSWHAAHDPLTGLINRREFEIHVADALASAKNEGDIHALLYLDLDQFKVVNDTCGHNAGDVLLKVLSKTLHSQMRDADILARLGGDEFGALLLKCPLEQALHLADKLRQAVKDFRFVWDKYTFEIGVSIGLVVINEDSKSMSELLSAADQACYVAKEQGRNRVHFYQESDVMLAKRHGEVLWVSRLNEAFEKKHFVLYTQPIVSLNGITKPHAEVLLRMTNGNGELILPGAFIPAAERYDIMLSIDRWVIETVCSWLKNERDEEYRTGEAGEAMAHARSSYAINLSGMSLNDRFLHDFVIEKFQQYEVDPKRICFEITETAIISNLDKAHHFMENIKELGCRFSLDDFGSGLSSFAYLKALPVDYLKIDGLFIRDIATNSINRAMVNAINEVGHVMGIETIAEFVETEAILDTVRNIGIDYAQGYAVGKVQPLIVL